MFKQRKYALRKVSGIGLASCCVGVLLFLGGGPISADETALTVSDTVISSSEVTDLKDETSSITNNIQESTVNTDNKANDESVEDKNTGTELTTTNESSDVGALEENKSEVTPEVISDTVDGNTTADGTDRVANMKERTANTSSSTEKPFDLTGWEKLISDSVVTNEFDFNGIHYRMETKMKAPFVANKIINTETGKANTYSFLSGDGGTSRVALYVNDIRNYDKYYYKASSEGINQILGITNTSGIEFSELFTVSKDGAFIHEIRLFNTSDNLQHQKVKINIDTELNGNDRIPIIADGNGGVYITDNDITIWGQPIDDLKAYASTYSAYLTNNPSEGREKGAEMSNNEDTAIVYTSDTFDLQPKEAKTFSWRESLFTDGLNPITMGTVTTNYVDAKGGKLSESTTQMGTQGSEYTTQSKDIPNYTLSSQPSNAKGVYTDGNIDVNYVYNKNQGTVTVNYLNEQNEKIADSTTITGDFDATYNTTAKQIGGYVLKTEPQNKSGVFGTGNTTVTYVYKKNIGNVTVSYVGEDGTKLADNTVISGVVGESYQTNAKDIDNYTLKSTPNNSKGTYTEGSQNVTYVYAKKTGSITAHYVNEDGEKVSEDATLSGTFDKDYSLVTKEIENYTLKTKPQVTSGKFGTDSKEVNFVYSKKKGTITVKYLDEGGTRLADDTVKSGTFDQDYQSQPKEIANYNLKTSPTNQTGKYGTTNRELIYIYSKKTAKVTVHYVGEDGTKLADDVVMSGTFDQDYRVQPKDIENYNLKTSPNHATGKYGTANQELNYIYAKKTAKVTVHYVGEDGSKLADDVVMSGTFDQDYTLTPKDITNYNLKQSPSANTGKFGTSNQVFKYVYSKKVGKVIVHYLSEDGTKLSDDVVSSGTFDQDFKIAPKDIKNYNLKKSPSVNTGKFGTSVSDFTYVYSKKQGTLIIRYVNEENETISDSVSKTGNFDEEYSIDIKDIDNYSVKTSPNNLKGLFGTDKTEVVIIYSKKKGSVTIRYVDKNGNSLHEPDIKVGSFDELWESLPITLDNYNLDTKPVSESGLFGTSNQELTYVYSKKKGSVVIEYKDTKGNKLHDSIHLSGDFDEEWKSEALDIENYELTQLPSVEQGTFGVTNDDCTVVTYVYSKKRGKLIVKFLDSDGKELKDTLVLEDDFDKEYDIKEEGIEGYSLVSKSDELKGTFGTSEKTLVFEYKKQEKPSPTVKSEVVTPVKEVKTTEVLPKSGSQDTGLLKELGVSIILMSTGVFGFVRRFISKENN